MDGGPFRIQQSGDKGDTPKREPVRRASADTKVSQEVTHQGSTAAYNGIMMPLWVLWTTFAFIAVALVTIASLYVMGATSNRSLGIDSSKYQAVSMTGDNSGASQILFGKLSYYNDNYLKLSNVYYLQPEASDSEVNVEDGAEPTSNFTLIKYGNEVYGPENEMLIARSQILYYVDLQPDGKVAKAIAKVENVN